MTLEMFKHYKNEVENQLNKKIKVIRSDRDGKYKASLMNYVPKMILFSKLCFLFTSTKWHYKMSDPDIKKTMNVILIVLGAPQNL
jgi:hypothetical protein